MERAYQNLLDNNRLMRYKWSCLSANGVNRSNHKINQSPIITVIIDPKSWALVDKPTSVIRSGISNKSLHIYHESAVHRRRRLYGRLGIQISLKNPLRQNSAIFCSCTTNIIIRTGTSCKSNPRPNVCPPQISPLFHYRLLLISKLYLV